MLLASTALASAPPAAMPVRPFKGVMASSSLSLTSDAVSVVARLFSGVSVARQQTVMTSAPHIVAGLHTYHSPSRTVKI